MKVKKKTNLKLAKVHESIEVRIFTICFLLAAYAGVTSDSRSLQHPQVTY